MIKGNSNGIVTFLMASLLCFALIIPQISLAGSGSYNGKKSQQLASGDKTSTYYCGKAQRSETPEREANLLLCANALLKTHQIAQAQDILSQINRFPFEGSLLTFKRLVDARLALAMDDAPRALSLLKQISATTMSLPVGIEFHDLMARAYEETGDYLNSVTQRVQLDAILSDKDMVETNNQLIWDTLQHMNPRDLKQAAEKTQNYTLRGWLELALIERNMDTSSLATWESQYRGHPGEALLPNNMTPTTLADFEAQHIALLLPLSGSHSTLAQAVRDGFMASLALTHHHGGMAPRISVFDTQDDQNINDAYQQAIQDGADMIIGPLTKPGVEQISRIASGNVPVLALNYADTNNRSNIFQFGLSPEDEARQAADRAWQDGHVNALVIAQDGEWGDRISQAFIERWESLGGVTLGSTTFSPNKPLSSAIKNALHIDTSEQRAEELSNSLNIPLEFEPRRRQDFDMVFIAAQPTEARQIPPLLAFYFAQDIPIYATSSVYSGEGNFAIDKDLNGVTFCDIPWNTDSQPTSPQPNNPIAALWPTPAQSQPRLYALGIDAYQLIPVLPRLEAIPHFSLNGATGKLSLDKNHRIIRTLRCTHFVNGQPKRLDSNV